MRVILTMIACLAVAGVLVFHHCGKTDESTILTHQVAAEPARNGPEAENKNANEDAPIMEEAENETKDMLSIDHLFREEDIREEQMLRRNTETEPERKLTLEQTTRKLNDEQLIGPRGDPHFLTWRNEHFEYHGQCDLVLTSDPDFANGLGLEVHIRTKMIRYWSYIKTAAIRIGNDILEIEGSAIENSFSNNYWINYEDHGELTDLAGFPVTTKVSNSDKRIFEIDLSQLYPNQKIIISNYKEFIRIDFPNNSEEAFGKTVGMLGDFKTGKTVARDGVTVMDDFYEFGNEWQVLPADGKIFRQIEVPNFPQRCIEPEDPRGDRRRRLDEVTVTEEQAQKACAALKNPLDRKDCMYDILATQDLEMVGAY